MRQASVHHTPSSSSSDKCWSTLARLLAVMAPLAATAGRPMPAQGKAAWSGAQSIGHSCSPDGCSRWQADESWNLARSPTVLFLVSHSLQLSCSSHSSSGGSS